MSKLSKNPVLNFKAGIKDEHFAGNLFEEIQENDTTNAGWAETVLTSLACFGASYIIGNKGVMCTWTVECQNNCR